jgi:hypothetical protein
LQNLRADTNLNGFDSEKIEAIAARAREKSPTVKREFDGDERQTLLTNNEAEHRKQSSS